jgi:hypothetical protein
VKKLGPRPNTEIAHKTDKKKGQKKERRLSHTEDSVKHVEDC